MHFQSMTSFCRSQTECFPLCHTHSSILLSLYFGFFQFFQYRNQTHSPAVPRPAVNPFLRTSCKFARFDTSGLRVILNSKLYNTVHRSATLYRLTLQLFVKYNLIMIIRCFSTAFIKTLPLQCVMVDFEPFLHRP